MNKEDLKVGMEIKKDDTGINYKITAIGQENILAVDLYDNVGCENTISIDNLRYYEIVKQNVKIYEHFYKANHNNDIMTIIKFSDEKTIRYGYEYLGTKEIEL